MRKNDDVISRQAAIDAINHICPVDTEYDCTLLDRVDVRCVLSGLPSVQPGEEKISDALYRIYRNTSPHTSAEGVAAIKYYIREIYREIFGEEGPKWLKK